MLSEMKTEERGIISKTVAPALLSTLLIAANNKLGDDDDESF